MNFANYLKVNAQKHKFKAALIERHPASQQNRTLSWEQFNLEVNKVANYLKTNLEVKKGDRVLHLFNNSLEWITTYFGIIKIGAIVVPLNFRFIEGDIQYAARISSPCAFLFGSEFNTRVCNVQKDLDTVRHFVVCGDDCPEGMVPFTEIENFDITSEALVDMQDEDILAVMFTSGTTGNAKPVAHTHGSLNATAIGNGLSLPLTPQDNYLIVLPLYHSGSFFMWLPYYTLGATGVLIRAYREPQWILEAIDEEKASTLLAVVPMCVDLINQVERGKIDLQHYDLSAWKYLVTGAQPVPHTLFEKLTRLFPCKINPHLRRDRRGWRCYLDHLSRRYSAQARVHRETEFSGGRPHSGLGWKRRFTR